MNRKSYSHILDHVARDGLHENTDLAPRIMAQIQKGKSTTMQPRTSEARRGAAVRMKVFATAFLILLVLAILLASVPSVRAAIQRWVGYVPGIGLISEGQIRVLAEPVSVERDGITLRVEQVLVDSNQTAVVYSVEGLTADMLDSNPIGDTPGCYKDAVLRFGEDEYSSTNLVGTSWMTGYEHKTTYPAIPSTVDEVTLVMPCVRSALPGKAPENWELSFHLIPAPPDMTAFPVIEISTPAQVATTTPPQTDTTGTNTRLSPDGISLSLDRAVQMDDGYLIYATLHWENTRFSSIDLSDITALHLLDANGQDISYNLDQDAMNSFTYQRGQTPLAIHTAPILVAGPVTLVIDSAAVGVAVPRDVTFTFDPGPNPKPGQVWELNQDLDVGYGHSLRVLTAKYPTPPLKNLPQQAGFSFEMESKSGITNAMLFDDANPLTGSGGGGGGSFSGIFSSGFSYAGQMPEGPITVRVDSISVNLRGPWQAVWIPPEPQTIPTSQSTACITRESWLKALQAHPSLPTGLSGTLAISDLLPPDFQYKVSIAGLDGSNLRSIGFGFAPSLSPDGARVVYIGPSVDGPADGLYITDLASGNTSRLPGTTTGDLNPLFSPDGQQIAYTRGPSSGLIGAPGSYSLMLMNVDGSNVRQLTDSSDVSYAVAWMPDGNHLLYNKPSRDAVSLYMMDVQTGEASLMFESNNNGTVVVSPDGKRLAFEEMLPLDKYGLFVSNLAGSNRKLLADGDPYIVTVPAWSPDGNWVITSVHDPDTNKRPNPTLALIRVDTCKIVPLANLTGYVTSWLP